MKNNKPRKGEEWEFCKRCGDGLENAPIDYYPYCSEYCEDRGMNPEGDNEPDLTDRLRAGFRHLKD